ncbi:MAG: biotin transporter BioY, partial [Clostridiales bacterium]|nr:biotin transporter BioY [Clostridiales bacterium]
MNRLLSWILCAVFAALTGVLSQIQIPLPFTPVPINLALLPVFICGGALGAKRGAVSMVIYILLGAVGAPVFVGFSGGVGALAGPTGGYILGYLPAAVIMGWFASKGANAETARKPALGGTLRG